MDLLELCEQRAFVEFASHVSVPFFLIDSKKHLRFSSEPHSHLVTAGRVHNADCNFCKREDAPCPIETALASEESRHLRLPAHLCGGGRDVVLDLIPMKTETQEPYLLVFQREADTVDQALSAVEAGTMRRERQLGILNHLLSSLQKCRDFQKILRVVLSGLTFGKGLEFNRAFFFRLDEGVLVGEMALGPLDATEATKLWGHSLEEDLDLEELLDPERNFAVDRPIQRLIDRFHLPLSFFSESTQEALTRFACTHLDRTMASTTEVKLMEQIGSDEIWMVPVFTQGKNIASGVLLVDNAITKRQPSEEHLSALVSLAQHVGFAMERTRLNTALEDRLKELQSALEELDASHQRLLQTEKLAMVGRVAANLAHELKTPMVSIGGFASVLARELPKQGLTAKAIQVILKESKRVERVLDALSQYDKATLLQLEDFDITVILRESLKSFRQVNAFQLTCEWPTGSLLMRGDPLRMKQLIQGLLHNLLDHAKGFDTLWVEVESLDEEILIRLEDNGEGLGKESAESIFEPFQSANPSALGLGLTHARELAVLHGGSLSYVEPKHEEGFALLLRLPRRKDG
jgi:signal transduction histidine kinase